MFIKRFAFSLMFILSLNSCTIIMDSSINTQPELGERKQPTTSRDLNNQINVLIERIRELEEERQDAIDESSSQPVCGQFQLPRIPPAPPMPDIDDDASDDEFSQALVEYVTKLGRHSDRVIAKIRSAYDRYSEACNTNT